MLKLLVVEDHALVREGLVQTLRRLEDEVAIFEAVDFDGAVATLVRERDFDLILLDLGLPGTDGLTCLGMLRQSYPSIPVVIVSAFDDAHMVNQVLNLGASGFVPKAYSGDRLLTALREVLDGGIFTPEQMMPVSLGSELPHMPKSGEASPAEFGLTGRQVDVLSLMVHGKSNRDIGLMLGLSEGTVKVHATAIFKSLGVASRTQALLAVRRYRIKLK